MEKVNNTEKKSRFHKLMESEFFYHYRRNASAIIGSIIILLAILIAVFGRGLAPQNPYDLTQLDIANGYLPPMWMEGGSAQFPLGTDVQGRCILSSIIYGSASSLVIGVVGMLLSCILGTTLGLISGYSDGFLGNLIMRIADVQLSFPSMFIALVVLAIMGQGVDKLLIALVLCGWVTYARTVRGVTLSVHICLQDDWTAQISNRSAACHAQCDHIGGRSGNDSNGQLYFDGGNSQLSRRRRPCYAALSRPAGEKRL